MVVVWYLICYMDHDFTTFYIWAIKIGTAIKVFAYFNHLFVTSVMHSFCVCDEECLKNLNRVYM